MDRIFLCISSACSDNQGASKSGTGSEPGHNHCANVWFPRLLNMLIDHAIVLAKEPCTLTLPSNQETVLASFSQKSHLSGMQIIRNSLTTRDIPVKAASHILVLEEGVNKISILSTSENGWCFAVQGVLIHSDSKLLQYRR